MLRHALLHIRGPQHLVMVEVNDHERAQQLMAAAELQAHAMHSKNKWNWHALVQHAHKL